MTTDGRPPDRAPADAADDRCARLERLRQRRTAVTSGAGSRPEGGSGQQSRRRRRPHAATGGRILVAGASAGAAVALMAAMAQPLPSPAPAPTPEAPAVVVVNRRSSGSATSGTAPPVARTDAPPVTTSQAS